MIQLRSVRIPEGDDLPDAYPFSLPLVRTLGTLEFDSEVTILAGENGSGKSTLIEAIGLAADLPVVGGERAATDKTLAPLRPLARALRLAWSRRTHRGFLFRAEDFFRFARRLTETTDELKTWRDEFAERFKDRPYARGLAMGVMSGQIAAIEERYEGDLHARSHGESFLTFFQARFVPDGLYLMDEPEASLSPQRQLSLLALMRDMVGRGAQFVVATHAPILMAYPDAAILSLDELPIRRVAYDDLEHVALTRSFLANPEAFLRRL